MIILLPFVRRHGMAIFLAALAALIVVAPLIAFPLVAREGYRGINISPFGSDQHYYLSRFNDALAGNTTGQPFLREWKGEQDSPFSYLERALALPPRLLGFGELNHVTLYNVLNGLGIFALVLLIYAFSMRLVGDRLLSIGLALFVVLGYAVIEAKELFYPSPIMYGRMLFPMASSIPVFLFLILLHDAVVLKGGWRREVAAGIVLGMVVYTYYFAWTFLAALLASLGLIFLILRDWAAIRSICTIGACGLALGAYNIIRLLTYYTSAIGEQVSFYQSAVRSHLPIMSKIGLGTIGLAAVSAYLSGRDTRTYFVYGLMLAGWVALNQQVITGRLVQYGHYYWYFIVPLSVVIGGYFLSRSLPKRVTRLLAALLVAFALINGIGQQYRAFFRTLPTKMREQQYGPVLDVLADLTRAVVVAGAGAGTDTLLVTIYTPHDLYWIPAARLHAFELVRLREALELHLYMNPDARKDPTLFLQKELADGASYKNEYVYLYTELEGRYSGLEHKEYLRVLESGEKSFGGARENLLEEIRRDFAAKFDSPDKVRALLDERSVRYIIWDTSRYGAWDLGVLGPIEQIASSGTLVLYRRAGP